MLPITWMIIFLVLPITHIVGFNRKVENLLQKVKEDEVGLSPTCLKHLDGALKNGALLRMFDASTKIPEGVLSGRFFHLGDYDECLATTYTTEENLQNITHYARYCLGTIPFTADSGTQELTSRMLNFDSNTLGLHTAVCFPSGCTPEEISLLSLWGNLNIILPQYCYQADKPQELTDGALAAIIILGIFIFITAASTIYDCCKFYTNQKNSYEILTAFSIMSNGRKLFKFNSNADQLNCLNGLKAISMMWVIIGHQYGTIMAMAPVANMLALDGWASEFGSMFIIGATVSVDTFFCIGGLVTVYTFLKATDRGVKFNILLYYFHRYLRLVPVLAIVILVHAYLLKYLGDGPMWGSVDSTLQSICRKNWWHNLLFIQNYVAGMNDMCVIQTWYLSVDMQLFVLSPLILLPLVTYPVLTLLVLVTLTVIGMIIPFVLGWVYDLPGLMYTEDQDAMVNHQNIYYIQTYARFSTYTIGMIFGYYLYHIKQAKLRLNLQFTKVIILWTITMFGLIACVYGGHWLLNSDHDKVANSIYLALNRPAWAICVGLCIFACISGYGGPVNTFLSLPIFQFLTKVSYSMYLIHYPIVVLAYYSQRNVIQFSNFELMTRFWGTFMLTLSISIVLCLMFESPIIIIEKLLFKSKPKNKTVSLS